MTHNGNVVTASPTAQAAMLAITFPSLFVVVGCKL